MTSLARHALAIDIGGTKLALGVVRDDGFVVARAREPTRAEEGPQRIIARIGELGRRLLDDAGQGRDETWVGVGCCGPLDLHRGVALSPPNLPGWDELPVARLIGEALGTLGTLGSGVRTEHVVLENDANAAAVGERRFGAARGYDDFVYVTISTGIGGAAFVDGRLLHGAIGGAAEIGHMPVAVHGWPCACGNEGCVEAFSSGLSIARRARAAAAHAVARGEPTLLVDVAGAVDHITAATVVTAMQRGDVLASALWRETLEVLAAGLGAVINAYNPRRIVIGGGVANAGAALFTPLGPMVRRRAMPALAQGVDVVPAALGDDVGVLGAAAVAFAAMERQMTEGSS